MNFTREPIIETIISPKEGCKLLVRSSKAGSDTEEHYVDAVEVVSFGSAFFFRSMERPKAFLVPASDYEVLEVKEARVALKNVSHERSIKIGGGREAPMRHSHREPAQEREREPREAREPREHREPIVAAEEEGQEGGEDNALDEAINSRMEKRRDRRRRRHRRPSDEQEWSDRQQSQDEQKPQAESEQKARGGGAEDEAKVSSQMFSSLIPPPPRLISETISQYKDKEFMERPQVKEVVETKEVSEERQETEEPPEGPTGSESTPLSRVISSTHFSSLSGGSDSYFL